MNNQAAQGFAGFVAGMLICFLVVFLIVLVVYILFLLTLQKTMNEVSPRHRQMAPGMVWLSLIPLFNLVWNIIMVNKIAGSLSQEYRSRGWGTSGENFGKMTGSIWSWSGVVNIVISIVQNLLVLGAAGAAGPGGGAPELAIPVLILSGLTWIIALTSFICWIVYWVQISGYGSALRSRGGRRYQSDEEEDYADDYGRPRRRRDRDDDDDEIDDYDNRGR